MIKVYLLIQTPRQEVHSVSYFQIVTAEYEKSDFDPDQIKSKFSGCDQLILHEIFTDSKSAQDYQNALVEKATKEYTLYINKLPDLEEVKSRPFYVYLDEDLTETPGLYRLKKEDYVKLRSASSKVRLPTDQEIQSSEYIPSSVFPKNYELMKSLKLTDLRSIRTDPPVDQSHHHVICKHFDQVFSNWKSLLTVCQGISQKKSVYSMESALKIATELFPDHPEEVIQQIIEGTSEPGFSKPLQVNLDDQLPRIDAEFC